MNRRPLGRTGIEVSELSFGAVEIGMPYGFGVAGQEDMLDEAEAVRLLRAARDAGMNFFDTARGYGRSEAMIGRAFGDRRREVVIATKCAHFPADAASRSDGELRTFVEDSLAESLRALRTDYVDLYMVHNGSIELLRDGRVAGIYLRLRDKGVARSIGVSVNLPGETQFVIDSGAWDAIQAPMHLMDQRQADLLAAARQRGVGMVIRSVLFRGILTDRGRTLHPALKPIQDHRKLYEPICAETQLSLSDLATQFVLSFPEVASVLVGIDRQAYLDKALALAGRYLPGPIMDRLRGLGYSDPEWIDLPKWDRLGYLR